MTPDRFEDHAWKDIVPEDLLKIYAPYKRETFVGPNPALLLIDLYNLAYQGGAKAPLELQDSYPSSCGIYAHNAVEPTKWLIAAARAAGIPIFYCFGDTAPHSAPKRVGATHRKGVKRDPCDFEIFHEFTPQPGAILIPKQRASIFAGTPLVSHLNILGVNSVLVCGESTSGCVRASCVDAYSTGLHVSLVEECCFDRHEMIHKINLFDLHHKYADVMAVDEVVGHLGGLAGARNAAE
jgi:nicotinamidase-related amidase